MNEKEQKEAKALRVQIAALESRLIQLHIKAYLRRL